MTDGPDAVNGCGWCVVGRRLFIRLRKKKKEKEEKGKINFFLNFRPVNASWRCLDQGSIVREIDLCYTEEDKQNCQSQAIYL